MKTIDDNVLKWVAFPLVVILAIVEPIWLELKRLCTNSILVPKLRENYQKIKEIYFE